MKDRYVVVDCIGKSLSIKKSELVWVTYAEYFQLGIHFNTQPNVFVNTYFRSSIDYLYTKRSTKGARYVRKI